MREISNDTYTAIQPKKLKRSLNYSRAAQIITSQDWLQSKYSARATYYLRIVLINCKQNALFVSNFQI